MIWFLFLFIFFLSIKQLKRIGGEVKYSGFSRTFKQSRVHRIIKNFVIACFQVHPFFFSFTIFFILLFSDPLAIEKKDL